MKEFIELREQNKCPFCKKSMDNAKFKDELSRKEFKISGLCQTCINKTFSEKPESEAEGVNERSE